MTVFIAEVFISNKNYKLQVKKQTISYIGSTTAAKDTFKKICQNYQKKNKIRKTDQQQHSNKLSQKQKKF